MLFVHNDRLRIIKIVTFDFPQLFKKKNAKKFNPTTLQKEREI